MKLCLFSPDLEREKKKLKELKNQLEFLLFAPNVNNNKNLSPAIWCSYLAVYV